MSDFPPTNTASAINPTTSSSTTSKNRKKKNKKKQKKLAEDSTTQSEISSPALTDKENNDPVLGENASALPVTTTSADMNDASLQNNESITGSDPLGEQSSVTASALPAAPVAANNNSDNLAAKDTTTAVAINQSNTSTAIPAGGPVGIGAAGATVAAATAAAGTVAADKPKTRTPISLPDPLPLSDNAKFCIKSVVGAGYMDVHDIATQISKNVAAGDYKAKASLPPSSAATAPATTTRKAATQLKTDKPIPPPPTIAKDTPKDGSKFDPLKKAAAGVGAAIAGGGAAAAAKVKAKKESVTSSNNNVNQATTMTGASGLSENVQHCIQSVVNAASVDVYGILDPSKKKLEVKQQQQGPQLKRPEPAVGGGGPTQPAMPSSVKAADTAPAKKGGKFLDNRKSLKKKNCIIL